MNEILPGDRIRLTFADSGEVFEGQVRRYSPAWPGDSHIQTTSGRLISFAPDRTEIEVVRSLAIPWAPGFLVIGWVGHDPHVLEHDIFDVEDDDYSEKNEHLFEHLYYPCLFEPAANPGWWTTRCDMPGRDHVECTFHEEKLLSWSVWTAPVWYAQVILERAGKAVSVQRESADSPELAGEAERTRYPHLWEMLAKEAGLGAYFGSSKNPPGVPPQDLGPEDLEFRLRFDISPSCSHE